MSRLKTFGKYLLMFVAFYIFVTVAHMRQWNRMFIRAMKYRLKLTKQNQHLLMDM